MSRRRATGCFGCHLNIIIYYCVCRTTDPRYYYYYYYGCCCCSHNTRGIQRRAAAIRRPRADWLPLQRDRRVTPADLHTIYYTRTHTGYCGPGRPIIIYYNTWTGNTSYLLHYIAAAAAAATADTCPRLGSTCTIIFDNATYPTTAAAATSCAFNDYYLCSFDAAKS